MSIVAPLITSNCNIALPPPTQDPPTIADVGRAQLYVDQLTYLRTAFDLTTNIPTDTEIGAAKLYAKEVVSKCVTADTIKTNGDKLTVTVNNLATSINNMATSINNLATTVDTQFAEFTNTINERFDQLDKQMKNFQNTM